MSEITSIFNVEDNKDIQVIIKNLLCRRAGQTPKKWIPRGAKGFISATEDF